MPDRGRAGLTPGLPSCHLQWVVIWAGVGGARRRAWAGGPSHPAPSGPQFVCMECLVTASMDMFPRQLRKSGRRELLILAVSVTCYLIGLFLVTEVSSGPKAGPG